MKGGLREQCVPLNSLAVADSGSASAPVPVKPVYPATGKGAEARVSEVSVRIRALTSISKPFDLASLPFLLTCERSLQN